MSKRRHTAINEDCCTSFMVEMKPTHGSLKRNVRSGLQRRNNVATTDSADENVNMSYLQV